MNGLNRFTLWLNKVMAGRHGADQLTFALLILYCVLITVSRAAGFFLLSLVALALMVWCFYRIFSRNQAARWKENEHFMRFWRSISGWFKKCWNSISNTFRNLSRRFADRKTHRYFKCPNCNNTLRVPKGKGKIAITCPVCSTEFIRKT